MDEVINYLSLNFNISFFHFARRQNGQYFELTSDKVWGFKYITKYASSDTFPSLKCIENNIWFWGEGISNKKEIEMHQERTEIYKIPPGLSFIYDKGNILDSFSYSSNYINTNKERIDFFIKNRNNILEFEKSFLLRIEYIIKSTFHNSSNSPKSIFEPTKKLTQRETDILALFKTGFKLCEIAKLLNVSQGTLQNRINIIRSKLNCRTREQMLAVAIDLNLI